MAGRENRVGKGGGRQERTDRFVPEVSFRTCPSGSFTAHARRQEAVSCAREGWTGLVVTVIRGPLTAAGAGGEMSVKTPVSRADTFTPLARTSR